MALELEALFDLLNQAEEMEEKIVELAKTDRWSEFREVVLSREELLQSLDVNFKGLTPEESLLVEEKVRGAKKFSQYLQGYAAKTMADVKFHMGEYAKAKKAISAYKK
ncbi:hypothetical protein QWI17_04375 [Gilvimarinus sp. SDUM040013]|uniref:Flagellar protein FliT n=1 Tax=Gilvimarinus gilvus TaxID=3058038 RepID=A0ABU4RUW3_9GAMM|nr:hypothetical protein [Gilvimarinus sp. SDUM040013]MDO3385074.1 hypothetical protein [Gilvimarinus sp. SDUM040013]MDX6848449.1 hypothetical protein [Gilvimarinus sp. SDUM040013]